MEDPAMLHKFFGLFLKSMDSMSHLSFSSFVEAEARGSKSQHGFAKVREEKGKPTFRLCPARDPSHSRTSVP
jgi:hypothetical protein